MSLDYLEMDVLTLDALREAHTTILESLGDCYQREMDLAHGFFDGITDNPEVGPHLRDNTRLEAVKAGVSFAAHTWDWENMQRMGAPKDIAGQTLATLMAGGFSWIEAGHEVGSTA